MAQWTQITGFKDRATLLDADSLNTPLYQLKERTDFLYQQYQSLVGAGALQSVRLFSVPLDTTALPVAGDAVYLRPDTKVFAKALAAASMLDSFSLDQRGYAFGILEAVDATTNTGTLVVAGKLQLTTDTGAFLAADLLESGETFRNGPYFLSSVEPGKLTAFPSGIAVYVGNFSVLASSTTYLDTCYLSPQYYPSSAAHAHRQFALFSQPAGTQAYSDEVPVPTSVHYVRGFNPTLPGTLADVLPRLVIKGAWLGNTAVEYTFILADAAGTAAPASFDTAYIHWTSTDPTENGAGANKVRIPSFEVAVPFGDKGLSLVLENSLTTDWDSPISFDGGGTGDLPGKRTWVITAPNMTCGWLAHVQRGYFTGVRSSPPTTPPSFLVKGGPYTGEFNAESLTLVCGELVWLDYSAATIIDGDTVTISGKVFEFDDNGVTVTGYIPVTISADVSTTLDNLAAAVLAQGLTGIDIAQRYTPYVADVVISGPDSFGSGVLASTSGVTTQVIGAVRDLSTGCNFLVYDSVHHIPMDTSDPYWEAVYWTPIDLNNGLSVLSIPYDTAGDAASSDVIDFGDKFTLSFTDEAPGAYFEYAMGMHTDVNQWYPPIPLAGMALTMNGVELDSSYLFTDSSYTPGLTTLYWNRHLYNTVPWPVDWASITDPGAAENVLNTVLHLVKMTAGTTGVVTSLRPAPNSPISIHACGTNADAITGDLQVGVDFALTSQTTGISGYNAVKLVSGTQLQLGPMVEKIKAGNGIAVTSEAGQPAGQGTVTISATSQSYAGEFEEVGLENAKEEVIGMFPYIKLLGWINGSGSNVPSGYIGKFRVPHNLTGHYQVGVYLTVFGDTDIPQTNASIRYAGLTFTWSILYDYTQPGGEDAWDNLATGAYTSDPLQVDVPFGAWDPDAPAKIYTAYDPMMIHNDPSLVDKARRQAKVLGDLIPTTTVIPASPYVLPGTLVGIRVSRTASTQTGVAEYTGKVGFISLRWELKQV